MSAYLPGMRDPDETTEDYPGLIVCDARVTGSITLGHSRLPVWAFSGDWTFAEQGWDDLYGWDRDQWGGFVHNLLQHRGDFARLICVLADVQRIEGEREEDVWNAHQVQAGAHNVCSHQLEDLGWWQHPDLRDRLADALRRCLGALETPEAATSAPEGGDSPPQVRSPQRPPIGPENRDGA